ncbi:MAG: hypothetical protein N2169_00670 [bacterium]|nr:hypothetical protein [bacterium]
MNSLWFCTSILFSKTNGKIKYEKICINTQQKVNKTITKMSIPFIKKEILIDIKKKYIKINIIGIHMFIMKMLKSELIKISFISFLSVFLKIFSILGHEEEFSAGFMKNSI